MAKSKERTEADEFDEIVATISKEFGAGSILVGDQIAATHVEAFPSGIISLDVAMGCRGIPQGRVIEVYGTESSGKTTTCLTIAAACQSYFFEKKDRYGRVVFIDAEHALDPVWAAKLGVNVDKLFISQPNSGEEAMNIALRLINSGLVDLIIVDSVAALVPKAELEGEIGDKNIGAQARMMSQTLRKIEGPCSKKKVTVIFINQIREKIGVLFGCLHADTLIDFVDGRSIPIRQVVEQRMHGEVWSYNCETRQFEANEIIGWYENGEVSNIDDYIHFTCSGPGTKNGAMQITVTPNHEILTIDNEWIKAADLTTGHTLMTKQPCYIFNQGKLNGTLGEFLCGILTGDSHIAKSKNKLNASLRLRDNIDIDYVTWKVQKLSPFLTMSKYRCNSGVFYQSSEEFEFTTLKDEYPNRDPMLLLNNFSWLGFAIWIMDDAIYERGRYHLSIKRLKGDFEKLDEISYQLDELGLYHHLSKGGHITFDVNISDMIASKIAIFVPPCMGRKLPSRSSGQYKDFTLDRRYDSTPAPVKIIDIRYASQRQMKQKTKYDISVARNQCYMAGGNPVGVIVHNSPETTPGGRALKFYASIRMSISKGSAIKEGEVVVGFRPTAKIVKNKVARPFMSAEFDICVGAAERPIYGVDQHACLIDVGLDMGIIKKNGSWVVFGDQRLGLGVAKAAQALRDNGQLYEQIRQEIYSRLGSNKPVIIVPTIDEEILDGD